MWNQFSCIIFRATRGQIFKLTFVSVRELSQVYCLWVAVGFGLLNILHVISTKFDTFASPILQSLSFVISSAYSSRLIWFTPPWGIYTLIYFSGCIGCSICHRYVTLGRVHLLLHESSFIRLFITDLNRRDSYFLPSVICVLFVESVIKAH
jgi:hypothetical protein